MASKRIAKTAVDWAKMQSLLPAEHQAVYTNLIAKSYQYTQKIASLPSELPKIDFDAYKKQLADPKIIEKLEKGYVSFKTSYPTDGENLLAKIDSFEKEEATRLAGFLQIVATSNASLVAEKEKLQNIPPLEEMTPELEVYYFPEKAVDPDYKEMLEFKDPYMAFVEARKKGGDQAHH